MKKSEIYVEQINNVVDAINNEIIDILKRLGGKVNLLYYTTEHHVERYGCVEIDNDGYPIFAEYNFIELDGNNFVVSASDWDDSCSFKLNKEDIGSGYVLGLLSMLEEIEEITETEGEVVDSYDYDY